MLPLDRILKSWTYDSLRAVPKSKPLRSLFLCCHCCRAISFSKRVRKDIKKMSRALLPERKMQPKKLLNFIFPAAVLALRRWAISGNDV